MRLLRRADFNAGANINTFWRMPCRGALEAGSRKAMTWDNKHITWFGTPPFLSKPKETYSFLQSSALFIPVATATLDGGVGLLLPMQEKTYRRLLMLQNALTTMLSHHAGLNPKAFRCMWDARRPPLALSGGLVSDFPICAFRMLHCDRRSLQNPVKNILDGELLNKYLYLSMMERSELAKKIGTTQDIVSPSVSAQRGGAPRLNLCFPSPDSGRPPGYRQGHRSFLRATVQHLNAPFSLDSKRCSREFAEHFLRNILYKLKPTKPEDKNSFRKPLVWLSLFS